MRIGLISNDFTAGRRPSLGGIGTSNHDLASGLTTAGHEVTVVGVYGDLEEDSESCEPGNGPRVVRLKASPVWFRYRAGAWFDRWRVRRWLAREHARRPFDVIELTDYAGWLPWGGPKGVPIVCRLQGANLFFDRELARTGDEFEHNFERRTLKMAAFWIGPSRYVFSKTLSLCSLEQHNGSVISNAVDAEVFSPGRTDEVEPGLIVFANSVNPKKGIEQLLDAMNLVCQSHPEAHLAVIGQNARTKAGGRNYLETLLERVRPEFRGRVTFLGWLDREVGLLNHLRRASVCCYPSHMETFGIAPIEAMAVGRPTIFSKTGPGPEVIEDGVSGLLCNPLDPGDIAHKIRLILDDAKLAARLGAEGRRRVLALFNKRDWIRRNIEFYESCVATMRPTRKPHVIAQNPTASNSIKGVLRKAAGNFLAKALRPIYSGIGSILCQHRVANRSDSSWVSPNAALEISGDSLELLIRHLIARDIQVISLDEVHAILTTGRKAKPFVAFTFDDGYRDNLTVAYPIFQRYRLPFTVNVTPSSVEDPGTMWWYRLEDLLRSATSISFSNRGTEVTMEAASFQQKNEAFETVEQIIRSLGPSERDEFLYRLFDRNPAGPGRERLVMTWAEVRQLAADPLVTIGAHTMRHYDLNKLTDEAVLFELNESRRVIESQIGRKVEHFAYPFGGRNAVGKREFALAKQCQFKTATTTRSANLFSEHAAHLECLPRITLSGGYPILSRFDLLQSGAPAAFSNRFRRLVTD